MFKKIKNTSLFWSFILLINLLSSEVPYQKEVLDPEKLTKVQLREFSNSIKTILDKEKLNITDESSASEGINKIREKVENLKDGKTKEKILRIYITDLTEFLKRKPESLDGYVDNIEIMHDYLMRVPLSLPEEEKEVADDLCELARKIIDIKKEEARGKISPEEWKKLPVMKLFRYYRSLDHDVPLNNIDNPAAKAFLEAIKNPDSLDFSSPLKQKDFDIIIKQLWDIIAKSEVQYGETVMTDKENKINNKNIESRLLYSDALNFIKTLVKKVRISDRKSIFSDYVKHSFDYDTYMTNATHKLLFRKIEYYHNANIFIEEIYKGSIRNLKTDSWLDYFYQVSNSGGLFGIFTKILILPIKIFDFLYYLPYNSSKNPSKNIRYTIF